MTNICMLVCDIQVYLSQLDLEIHFFFTHLTHSLESVFYILIISLSDNIQSVFPQVQSDHYEEFFSPELDKHGYYGLYKKKTNEVVTVFRFIIVLVS